MATYHPRRPACDTAQPPCPDLLRQMALDVGTEITVSTAAPLVVGPYPTETFTCPHGARYWIAPTREQVAQWAKDGTP